MDANIPREIVLVVVMPSLVCFETSLAALRGLYTTGENSGPLLDWFLRGIHFSLPCSLIIFWEMRVSFKDCHQYQSLCFGGKRKMGREQKVCTRNQQQPESSHMEKKASNRLLLPSTEEQHLCSRINKHISANLHWWTSFSSCFSYFNIHMHQECRHRILMQCLLVNYLHDNILVNPSKIRYFSVNQMASISSVSII